MHTRTRLTTPPGQEPSLSSDRRSEDEHYVPGLTLPEEPVVPGRRRRLWIVLTAVVLVVIGGYVAFRITTAGQQFDPALDPQLDPGMQSPADPADGSGQDE